MTQTSSLTDKLAEIRRREEETSTKDLARRLNLPYLDLFGLPLDSDGLKLLPRKEAESGRLIIVRKQGKNLEIAAVNPNDAETKKALENIKTQGFSFSIFLVSNSSIEESLKHYEQVSIAAEKKVGQMEVSASVVEKIQREIKGFEDIKEKIEKTPSSQTSELLEAILAGALSIDASDVHFEPKEDITSLKYRLDGLLHEINILPLKSYNLILSRIKLLSGMKLNIKDVAQDGRFTIKLKQSNIEIRSSVIPGAYGETIVLRILNPKTISLNLEDLGFRQESLEILEREIRKPNGLIITTGPTGSGKTTTLYAFIKKVAKPEIKIITLEDPVEYKLPGITQTQVEVDAGYTFAAGLRAILRQDPDVILVGEIRDSETAKTALNASLTGHLVFSTLHTNDAAGAIPRLLDLEVDKGSLAASLNIIMAQRLIRKLCQACRQKYNPPEEILKKIQSALKGIKHPPLEKTIFYQAKGCSECHNIGYKGRIGVLEIIEVDAEIEKLISKSPSHAEISALSQKRGIITMYQDGLLKLLSGTTTFEEIERVLEES
jgi:type IV pilus assembly protein PilB